MSDLEATKRAVLETVRAMDREGLTEGTAGNVQVFVRRDGENHNPSLTRFHPEIRDPQDEVPELSCAGLAATTAPQIVSLRAWMDHLTPQ